MGRGFWNNLCSGCFIGLLGLFAFPSSCEWVGEPTITITAQEYRFSPSILHAPPNESLRVIVKNLGREPHVFQSPGLLSLTDLGTSNYEQVEQKQGHAVIIHPDQSIEFQVQLPPGSYSFRCWIKGHQGMEGRIVVESPEK